MLRISRHREFPSDGASPGAKTRVRIAPVKMNPQAPKTAISKSLRDSFMLRLSLQILLLRLARGGIAAPIPAPQCLIRKPEVHPKQCSTTPHRATNRQE